MLDFKNKSKLLTPIVTSNLSIILGKTKILDQINCKIKNKSIVAVLGPNGAGKSMFLKTINGLIGIDSGKIFFNSKEINDHIRKEIAMVFQKPILLRRTVFENMKFILKKIRNKKNRSAVFVCSLSYKYPNGRLVNVVGKVYGTISVKILGKKGFGYDPIFIPKSQKKTYGQISKIKKINSDHRYIAFKKLKNKIKTL